MPAFAHARLPAATKNDLFVVPRTTEKRQLARQLTLPGGLDVPVVLMLMVVLLSIAAFVFWYWDRTVERSLAPSTDAASIHWQQSALPTAPPPEPATDPEPAIDMVDKGWSGSLPATFLYNAKGEVVYKHFGRVDPNELRAAIDKLVKKTDE